MQQGSLSLQPDPRDLSKLSMKSQHTESRLNHSLLCTQFQVSELRPKPHVRVTTCYIQSPLKE